MLVGRSVSRPTEHEGIREWNATNDANTTYLAHICALGCLIQVRLLVDYFNVHLVLVARALAGGS